MQPVSLDGSRKDRQRPYSKGKLFDVCHNTAGMSGERA